MALTTISVRNMRPVTGSRREVPDGRSGLYLIVQPTGRKSWAFRYRAAGRPAKLTLGRVWELEKGEAEPDDAPSIGATMTLRQARELVAGLQRKVAKGEDPSPPPTTQKDVPATFSVAFKDFEERHVMVKTRPRSAAETKRLVATKVTPVWGSRRLDSITRRDVISLLDAIATGGAPTSANRVLAAVRKFFNWCVERDLLAASPCVGVRAPTQERSRDRVLTDQELGLVWRASDTLSKPFDAFVKILILTGQRREEVAQMRWSELDFDGRIWRLPRERVKNDKAHDVPLSDQALAVLKAVTRLAGDPDFVFTTGNRRRALANNPEARKAVVPISGISKSKSVLDEAMSSLRLADALKAGLDAASVKAVEPWRLHDLRRTMATGMAKNGVALPAIEKVLNHQSGSFAGIVGVYQRHTYADEKRAAMDGWGKVVVRLARESFEVG